MLISLDSVSDMSYIIVMVREETGGESDNGNDHHHHHSDNDHHRNRQEVEPDVHAPENVVKKGDRTMTESTLILLWRKRPMNKYQIAKAKKAEEKKRRRDAERDEAIAGALHRLENPDPPWFR